MLKNALDALESQITENMTHSQFSLLTKNVMSTIYHGPCSMAFENFEGFLEPGFEVKQYGAQNFFYLHSTIDYLLEMDVDLTIRAIGEAGNLSLLENGNHVRAVIKTVNAKNSIGSTNMDHGPLGLKYNMNVNGPIMFCSILGLRIDHEKLTDDIRET